MGFFAPVFHTCSQYTFVMICVPLVPRVLIRVLTRFRIRWWSGAEKCVGGARWGTGLSCRP